MRHNKQMDADKATLRGHLLIVGDLIDFALANLVGVLHLFQESLVSVDAIALLEDDRAYFSKRLLHPLSLDFQLRNDTDIIFGPFDAICFHLLHALLDGFAFDSSQIFMSLTDVLIGISG